MIKKLCKGQSSKARAREELDLSRRQTNRLIQIYQSQGKKGFQHGNKSRTLSTDLLKETKKEILELYKTKYEGFKLTHFTEKPNEEKKIEVSYTTVRSLLYQKHLLSPSCLSKNEKKVAE